MSTNPVIFKRTKSKSAQRSRQPSPGGTEEESGSGGVTPSTLVTKLKKRDKPKSKLSFGAYEEEGDGEVFKIKKSNLSLKVASSKLPASSGNALDQTTSSRSSSGPTYDKAYLSELKASTPGSRPSQVVNNDPYAPDLSLDPYDMSSQSMDIDESVTAIPSESSILASKQKRDRLRTTALTGESDYISLSVTRLTDERDEPHPESRLVREEDEVGEGDDEFAEYTSAMERIALGKKSKKVEAQNRRDALKEMIADVEEDDETMEWEQAQLRRGGHFKETAGESVKETYKAAPIPPVTPLPTLTSAIGRLTQSLNDLTTSHANDVSSIAALEDERTKLDAREAEMREMIKEAEEKRSWFAAFREWVEGVAAFLDEKFPKLEKLEDEHVSLLRERSDMISRRRSRDDEDDLSVFFGPLPSPVAQPEEETLDELGRIVPDANPTVARRERRSARLTRRSRRTANSGTEIEEGYSTDSSLHSSDAIDFTTAMQSLLADRKAILSDVRVSEFKDPRRGIAKWFGEWRSRFASMYSGAWGGLGVVGAWEFWARLEIMGWDPLDDSRNLASFSWYSSLQEYSHPDNEEPKAESDGDLVSAMISTAIIPRLCKIVAGGALDPYSAKGVRRMVELTTEVEASLGADNAKVQMLLKSVQSSFQHAVAETETLISRYRGQDAARFEPEAIPARRRFLARRIKLMQNVLRWREYTGEKFGIGELCTRLVENSIFPVAQGGWDVGGEESVRKVTALLPRELVPESIASRL